MSIGECWRICGGVLEMRELSNVITSTSSRTKTFKVHG